MSRAEIALIYKLHRVPLSGLRIAVKALAERCFRRHHAVKARGSPRV